ncbi:hypothetical protein [Dactylosporangium sp. NPDC048998]|uniref:hypothetical protein n=1 Tax=Dactylosporangium sp. NPDC048998 TaxID=3363976 RepID=UPI0037109FF7
MTPVLRSVLADLAEQSRPLSGRDDLWRRGRRLRRRRRLTAAAGGLLALSALLAFVALPPGWNGAPGPVRVADGGNVVLPRSFGTAWPWQELAGRSPNGPAMFLYVDTFSRLALTPATVIGQDGSYRGITVAGSQRLSPDGRLLARKDRIIDLTSGQAVRLTAYEHSSVQVLDWSPRSTEVLMFVDADPAGADPAARQDRIVVVDAATGRARTVHAAGVDPATPDSEGMFSPDGTSIALVLRKSAGPQRVTILDAADGAVRAELPLTDRQRVAGWNAGGTGLVLLAGEVCDWSSCARDQPSYQRMLEARGRQRWHLQFADPVTGTVTDERRAGRTGWPNRLVGWHGRDSFWIMDDHSIDAVRPGEPAKVLTVADGQVQQLDVADDLVIQGRFDGPPLRAQIWPPRAEVRWALGIGAVVVAAAILFLRRRMLRTRRPESFATDAVR